MPTTEIATLQLAPGNDVGDPNNDASRIVNECCGVIAQQPGLQTIRFGPVVEDSSKMEMFIDWDSKQNHADFTASEAYKPFFEKFSTIIGGPPTFKHVDFEGDPTGAFNAPVTEIATFHYSDPNFDEVGWTKQIHDFIAANQDTLKAQKYAIGPTHEKDLDHKGVKGRAGVLIMGWESLEQHQEMRKLEVFGKFRGMMAPGAPGVEVHHTTVMNFVAG